MRRLANLARLLTGGELPAGGSTRLRSVVRGITLLGALLGVGVILFGLERFFANGLLPPLLIAIAVLIVGPGEDILKERVKRWDGPEDEHPIRILLVDRTTSAVFLLCLLLTIVLSR